MTTHLAAEAAEQLVRLDRPFQVWMYAVGHRQLLLRSVKTDSLTTRVDLLFKDVRAMLMHPRMPGVTLERAAKGEASRFSELLGLPEETEVYALSREPLLLVAASVAVWHEDEGEYFDPCFFDVLAPSGLAAPV